MREKRFLAILKLVPSQTLVKPSCLRLHWSSNSEIFEIKLNTYHKVILGYINLISQWELLLPGYIDTILFRKYIIDMIYLINIYFCLECLLPLSRKRRFWNIHLLVLSHVIAKISFSCKIRFAHHHIETSIGKLNLSFTHRMSILFSQVIVRCYNYCSEIM